MEVVNGALKPFNDGLYAAVELEAEAGKRQLFAALAARLTTLAAAADATARPAFDDAAVLVGAAQILAGETPTIDASPCRPARAIAPPRSRPTQRFARPDRVLHLDARRWSASSPAIGSSRTATTTSPTGRSPRSRSCSARMRRCSPTTSASPALYAGLTNPFTSYTIDALIPYVTSQAALANPAAIVSAFVAATPALKACIVRAGRVPARVAQQGLELLRRAVLLRPPAPGPTCSTC